MKQTLVIGGLLGLAWLSGFAVIYTKHESRQRVAQLQNLQEERDALHVEWTQLLLEQGTWATYSRVEKMARETLDMALPAAGNVRVVDNNEVEGLAKGKGNAG